MTSQTLFYIIIGILVFSFIVDKILDALNAKHFNDSLPEEIKDQLECKMKLAIIEDKKKKLKEKLKALKEDLNEEKYECC